MADPWLETVCLDTLVDLLPRGLRAAIDRCIRRGMNTATLRQVLRGMTRRAARADNTLIELACDEYLDRVERGAIIVPPADQLGDGGPSAAGPAADGGPELPTVGPPSP